MDPLFLEIPDEILCARAVSGDSRAEEALILRHSRMVRSCARPLFLVGGDSEDLTQEGMLGLLDAIRQFDPNRAVSFRTFAEVCVQNRLRSAVRANRRDKHLPLNASVSLEQADAEGENLRPTNPEEMVIAKEVWDEQMARVQDRLSPLETRVLGLYLTGVSYEEIGQKLQRSAKSVDNAVQRIRRKLARP